MAPYASSALPSILNRCGQLHAAHAEDGEELHAGRVYVAPPDHHLIVYDGKIGVTQGPKENGVRPAIDPLFRTAVHALGRRVIAVVLSGSLDDGTEGLRVVKARGGTTVAQDPDDALFPSMPANAIRYARPDHIVTLAALPQLLVELADKLSNRHSPHEEAPMDDQMETDASADAQDGEITELRCPDCGGTLWET